VTREIDRFSRGVLGGCIGGRKHLDDLAARNGDAVILQEVICAQTDTFACVRS
jgi:hypothetical protein